MQDMAQIDTQHRDLLREKKRQWYYQHRDVVLKRQRGDRKECPLCKISYRRLYLKTHLENRHRLPMSQIEALLE